MPMVNGKARWARVYEKSRDFGFDENGKYSIDLEVEPSLAKEMASQGIPVTYDGDTAILKFNRKHIIMKDGNPALLGPPSVVGPDGKTAFTDLIGNGSNVNVMYRVNEWKDKKGLKLEGVQVVDIVEVKTGFPDTTAAPKAPAEEPKSAKAAKEKVA